MLLWNNTNYDLVLNNICYIYIAKLKFPTNHKPNQFCKFMFTVKKEISYKCTIN